MSISKIDRIKEIADEVRNLVKPSEVIPVSHRVGKSWTGTCPYHGGKNKGNFMVSDEKKIFKCFNCGAKGDVIRFFADQNNINYAQATLQLAEKYNIITSSEFEKLSARNVSKKDVVKIENHFMKEDNNKKIIINEKAEDKVLDKIYRLFIKSIELSGKPKLSEKHLNYLKGRCSDEQIEEVGYFTFPTRYVRKVFFKLLEEEGYNVEILKSVPGFYYDEDRNEYTFVTSKSIGIPIRNEFGQIIAIQRRFDEVKEGENRYRWFSSSFSENGCSTGVPMEFILPKKVTNKTLFITEGHFKGYKIAETFGSPVLSIAGVQSWRKAVDKVICLIKNLSNIIKDFTVEYIFIAFDADMSSNLGVLSSSLSLGNAIKNSIEKLCNDTNPKYLNKNIKAINEKNDFIKFLVWDVNLGKGLDDFLNNGNSPKEKIYKVELNDMINYSYTFVKNLIENDKELLNNLYGETELKEKEISAENIFAISNKYWKVFKEVSNDCKENLFDRIILSNLSNYKNK